MSTLIKNGSILSGDGTEPIFKKDILIDDGRISKIGDLGKRDANLIIDATGLYVAPGFIDLTTHSDNHWTIFEHPNQESFLRQGVTTIIGGHGGSSLAPLIKKEAIQPLAKLTDISRVNINWQTMEEFFSRMSQAHLSVNYGTFVGLETLRKNFINSTCKEMADLLEKSLRAGAFGLSDDFDSREESLPPEEEIVSLLKVTAGRKKISTYHFRDEGKNLLPSVSRLIRILREADCRGHVAHFKALGSGAWGSFAKAIDMMELARAENVGLTCDFFPYTSTGSSLLSFMPPWVLSKSKEEILESLKNNKIRQEIENYLKSLTLHCDRIVIASAARDKSSIGKSIDQIRQESNLTGERIVLDLLLANGLLVSVFNEVISEKNIELLVQKSYTAVSSDGVGYDLRASVAEEKGASFKFDLPHPRSFGAFPRFVDLFVKQKGLINWETAVYKMSGLPASILGIKDRGVIKKGNWADLVIFDPKTIKDTATYERPIAWPEGIGYVFVNGVLVLAEEKLMTTGGGGVLRN